MDHFWIILRPFSTILLTVLSTVCQWSCALVHHFLEAKLLEQVNLHFWIIYNTHCWFNMLLCTQAPPTVPQLETPIYKTHPFSGPLLGQDSYKTHFKKTTI